MKLLFDHNLSYKLAGRLADVFPDSQHVRSVNLHELVLDVTEEADNLANELLKQVPLPEKAAVDALHISIATVNGIDYLLTWNCTHIANATMLHRIEAICHSAGFESATICTPQQLMEG
jgi:hypothetical protein